MSIWRELHSTQIFRGGSADSMTVYVVLDVTVTASPVTTNNNNNTD